MSNIDVEPSGAANAVPVKTNIVDGEHVPVYNAGFGPDGELTQVDSDNPMPITQGDSGQDNHTELIDAIRENTAHLKILCAYQAEGFGFTITKEDVENDDQ